MYHYRLVVRSTTPIHASMYKDFCRKYLYLSLLFLALLFIIVIVIDGSIYGYSWFTTFDPETRKLEDDIRENGYFTEKQLVQIKEVNFTLLRMRHHDEDNANGEPVLLVHGLFGSPADWLVGGPNKSLGYLLADAGYDVWILDCAECFKRSWHDIGVEYYPKIIDYVTEMSGRSNLSFVGHSSANTAFFAMASEYPETASKIRNQVSVAPIAYLDHSTNQLLQKINKLEQAFHNLEEFTYANLKLSIQHIQKHAQRKCKEDKYFDPEICTNPGFAFYDYHAYQLDPNKLKYVEPYTPDDVSVKGLQHFAQIAKSGNFSKFNYGRNGNMERYGSPNPPSYNMDIMEAPVHVLYSRNDSLTNEEDVNNLCRNVRNCFVHHIGDKFVGLDQKYGRDAPAQINQKIMEIIGDL